MKLIILEREIEKRSITEGVLITDYKESDEEFSEKINEILSKYSGMELKGDPKLLFDNNNYISSVIKSK